jgi:predicted DNA-binding protein
VTATTVGRVPNQPKTPVMAVRVPEETQTALKQLAAQDGTTVTRLVLAAIDQYLASREDK